MTAAKGDENAVPEPLLRIVSGNPTPEELAAVVTIVAAATAGDSASAAPVVDGWSAPSNMHRAPMPMPGPGAWLQLGRR